MRTGCGVFDVSHMGEIETVRPGRARAAPAAALQRRRQARGRRRPVLGALPRRRRRPRRPLHLPARRRPLPDRHQRRQPRARPRLVSRARRRLRRRGRPTASTTTRCSPSRARERARSSPRSLDGELPPRMHTAELGAARRGDEALVCGTGYTGEDGVEILIAPEAAPALWDALLDAGATPAGLGARDTLRLEVCFHLYGNDLSHRPQPDRGRPRLVLQGGDRLHRLRGGRRRRAPTGTAEKLAPVRAHRARHPAPGQRRARRRRAASAR